MASIQDHHIFAAILRKAAKTVEELKLARRTCGGGSSTLGEGARALWSSRKRLDGAIQVLVERATCGDQHHARHGKQQGTCLGCDKIGAQHEDRAARAFHANERLRLAGAHQCLERILQILHVRGLALVQDHQIDRKAFQAPVFMRAQQLPHDRNVRGIINSDEHDRQISGDAERPERGCDAAAAADGVG